MLVVSRNKEPKNLISVVIQLLQLIEIYSNVLSSLNESSNYYDDLITFNIDPDNGPINYYEIIDKFESEVLKRCYIYYDRNTTIMERNMGISRSAIRDKLIRYNIK